MATALEQNNSAGGQQTTAPRDARLSRGQYDVPSTTRGCSAQGAAGGGTWWCEVPAVIVDGMYCDSRRHGESQRGVAR